MDLIHLQADAPAEAKMKAALESASYYLRVQGNAREEYDRICTYYPDNQASRMGFDRWVGDLKGAVDRARADVETALDAYDAEQLQAVIEELGDRFSHISHRPKGGPASERAYFVYQVDRASPTGCKLARGGFRICQATDDVINRSEFGVEQGGHRGNSSTGV